MTKLSRRNFLSAAAASLLLPAPGPFLGRAAFAAPSTVKSPIGFTVPAGACDCHVHVFPDPSRYSPTRSFTPPEANAADLLALQNGLKMDRVVIVNSTVYGPTISPVLETIKALGQARARGIALFDEKLTTAELDDLHKGGIRGIRVFLGLTADVDLGSAVRALRVATAQIEGRPWNLQVYGKHPVLAALKAELAAVPVPLVFDHFAGIDAADGLAQSGFGEVLDLVRSGKAYVKVSGANYCSKLAPDYADMAPFARVLIAANPERILWGSDWPHPNSTPIAGRKATDLAPAVEIDDGAGLDRLAVWAPSDELRKKILVDNPKRLYGF